MTDLPTLLRTATPEDDLRELGDAMLRREKQMSLGYKERLGDVTPEEERYAAAHTATCEDCYGDSDPIDDCFYCVTCKGRGWVYENMIDAPCIDHREARALLIEEYRSGCLMAVEG